jgi:hypothetical protein
MEEGRFVERYGAAIRAALAITVIVAGCGDSVTTEHAAALHSGPTGAGAGARSAAPHGGVPGYGTLPISFEPNVGQAPIPVEYLARGVGYTVAITAQSAILSFERSALRLRLINSRPSPSLHADNQLASISNYFIGNDPSKWRSNIANYAAIRYEQVYPGIDWVVYGNPQQLEYDFVVSPQADPRRIEVKFEGAREISVDRRGELLVDVQDKILRQSKPVVYQTTPDGSRHVIEGRYVLHQRHVTFALGKYDHSRQLIIDPVFVYSTYLGGSGGDAAAAVAVDDDGNAYVAGGTTSLDFPTLEPFQGANQNRAWGNAFVSKFNSSGTALIYSTYLGGSGNSGFNGDAATAIALDSTGNAYVAGYTNSTNFPTVNPFQAVNNAAPNDGSNAFLVKLNAAGNALAYATYFGGSGRAHQAYVTGDSATALAVDGAGAAYVTGRATSMDLPTLMPFQATNKATSPDGTTAFVAKFDSSGSSLVYSTYLGGSTSLNGIGDLANAIAVDGEGNAYVAGATSAIDFPTIAAAQTLNRAVGVENGGVGNAFVAKFNASGSALLFSTYLGGSVNDSVLAVAVDAEGDSYVTGYTQSGDFPTLNAWQTTKKAGGVDSNAFVTKFNANGGMAYSTYLGGSTNDEANALAVDAGGDVYVAGSTFSSNFPVVNALQSTNNGTSHGSSNAFISEFDPTGRTLKFSTYLGGSGTMSAVQPACDCAPLYNGDSATGVAVDKMGNVYVAGTTYSTDFPTVMAFQDTNRTANPETGSTAFVAKIVTTPSSGPEIHGGGGAIEWLWLAVLGIFMGTQHLRSRSSALMTKYRSIP